MDIFSEKTRLMMAGEECPRSHAFGYAIGQLAWGAFLLFAIATIFSLLWSKVSGPLFKVPAPWSDVGWWNTVCIFWLAGISKKLYRLLRYGI